MAQNGTTAMRLLIVDDDEDLRDIFAQRFAKEGIQVTVAGSSEEALKALSEKDFHVTLLDLHLPGMNGIELLEKLKSHYPEMEVIMLTAHGSIDTAIQAMKIGAYDYLTKPVRFHELEVRAQKAYERALLARRQKRWSEQLRYESARYQLVGSSPQMQTIVKLIQKVAPTDATVLIRGPSGTGKELVARALHCNSIRSDAPLVTINCAALQETLLESELFGHEKGAFTGAGQTKPGLFEVAEEGTLFIDEIGEMAPGLQAKLLRVLEDGHYRRVGGTREHHANVRVVAATNRDLNEEISEGRFREDLFYRINVVTIELPSLQERPEDIPELIDHFLLTRAVGGARATVSPEAMGILTDYAWPGNVRELANVLERAQILAENNCITPDDLPDTLVESLPVERIESTASLRSLREVERQHIVRILQEENGNKVHAAKALGISRRALYRLLQKHGLENESFRSEPSDPKSS